MAPLGNLYQIVFAAVSAVLTFQKAIFIQKANACHRASRIKNPSTKKKTTSGFCSYLG
jgi:hypothetical protein